MIKKRILILFAHPAFHKSRVNKKMIAAMNDIEGITFINLYEEYPDFQIDIKKEQDLLLNHDIIIWHHPFYWYSAPAILKEWIDLVLQHGFAYGRMGTALKNKQVLSVITTGGRREAYQTDGFNQYTMRQFLVPFERTVTLCNMNYLPPFVVHGSHLLTEDEINSAARDYRKILISLRDDIFDQDDMMNCGYLNDLLVINRKL
jgi:glutathione-regulated potassium-efflux system ancillary protein KefG